MLFARLVISRVKSLKFTLARAIMSFLARKWSAIKPYLKAVCKMARHQWRSLILSATIVGILAYLLGILWSTFVLVISFTYFVYNLCDTMLYSPDCPDRSRTKVFSPLDYGFDSFEQKLILTEDKVLIHIIFLKLPSVERRSTAPTLVYLHGNAGNTGHRLPNAIELVNKLQVNVLLVEYRGYGFSQGSPSEKGLYLDVLAGLRFLYQRTDICATKIVLFGRSLGGAVAIGVAYQLANDTKMSTINAPAAMIVENTFTSIPDLSRHLCTDIIRNAKGPVSYIASIIRLLPEWFYKNHFDSCRKMSKILLPTLFLSGLADELIPVEQMQRLYNLSGSQYKELHKFESGSHNFTWKCAQYYATIEAFLANVFQKGSVSVAPEEHSMSSLPLPASSSSRVSTGAMDEKSPLITTDTFQSNDNSGCDGNSTPTTPTDTNHRVFYHSSVEGSLSAVTDFFSSSSPSKGLPAAVLISVEQDTPKRREFDELVDI